MMINSLRFCLGNSLYILYIWRFAPYSSLSWQFFSFITSNISCCSLLACKTSVNKLTDGFLIGVHLYMRSCFFLLLFAKFSLSLTFKKCDFSVSQCRLLQIHAIWSCLSLMDLDVPFPPWVWEVFSHYFSKYSFYPFPFSSFSHIIIILILVHLMVFSKPLRLSLLLFFFFFLSFCFFDQKIPILFLQVYFFIILLDQVCY